MARDAADIPNTFDPATVQNLVNKIEGLFSDIESERGAFMKKCRDIRESISNVYDEGAARGIPKKELRKLVSYRMKLDAARKVLADLEQDQVETVQLLAEAFGDAADLPLFEHRMNTVRNNSKHNDPVDQPFTS